LAYAALLVAWAVVILRRPVPTLWKGSALMVVNIAFTIACVSVIFLRGGIPGATVIGFCAFLIVTAAALRNKWLLLGIGRAESAAVLERCFVTARARWEHRDGFHVAQCGDTELAVLIRRDATGMISIRFIGDAESRKARLIRALFVKQFEGSYPTLRIRA
jgi:hypothetical protein